MQASVRCSCEGLSHDSRRVVLTGGPGAGKTAVLEVVRRNFCKHVVVLPESASIVFGGGFPRRSTTPGRRAAQRAIFHVQRELEALALDEGPAAVVLCDRGTLDGLAYWPDEEPSFFDAIGTTREEELARYAAVIHLRTPRRGHGYDQTNPLRVETASEAVLIDARIEAAWSGHPRRFFVESADGFLDKAMAAIGRIRDEIPSCCQEPAIDPALTAPTLRS